MRIESKAFGIFATLIAVMMTSAPARADVNVAGLRPFERPAWGPAIEAFNKSAAWYEHALFGVSQPYPASLHFLENQGPWFTPFAHPGMRAPYDIRNWHAADPSTPQ